MKGLLFTYLLTYGGAVFALFNPFVGLLVYFALANLRPETLWHWSVPPGNYSRTIAIALLIGWAVRGFGDWNFRGARPIVYAAAAYYGWMFFSALFAVNQDAAWACVVAQGKIFLPVIVGMTLIDSIAKLKLTAWVLMLSQAYVAFELNLGYLSDPHRFWRNGFGSMDNNVASVTMVAGAGLAFFLGIGDRVWWRKLLAFGSAALMAHVPMFGMSRGGMLGLIVTGVAAFFLIPKQPKHYLAFAVAVILALRLAGPQVVDRFAMTFAAAEVRDASAQSRVDLWRDCWDVMLKNPVVGVGPDNWPRIAHEYGWGEGKVAHSLWFQTGAELGFPGLAFLLAYFGFPVVYLLRLTRQNAQVAAEIADYSRMVIAALVGFVVPITFLSSRGLEMPYYVAMLGAAAIKLADDPTVDPAENDFDAQFAPAPVTESSFANL